MRAAHYDAVERALEADPVIQRMYRELENAGYDLPDLDGWDFIQAALQEYRRRGGTVQTHIGGPAAAIRHLARRTA